MPAVVTGFWIDYTRSPVFGATLTLKTSSSNYLLTTLTFLITIALSCAWRIVAFSTHHYISSRQPRDALDLQHRILLRNKGDAADTALTLIKLYISWARRRPPHLLRRTLRYLLPSAILLSASIYSTVFLSRIVNQGEAVRVVSNLCGVTTGLDRAIAWSGVKMADATCRAKMYISEAYLNESNSGFDNIRAIFRRPTLPYVVSDTAPCPFRNTTRCTLGKSAAFLMSSGMINSHDMLGMNAPLDSRVEFQVNMTCSPLQVDDLVTTFGSTMMINMGSSVESGSNYDGSYNNDTTNTIMIESKLSQVAYSFGSVEFYRNSNGTSNGTWLPAPEFQSMNQDEYVFGLNQFNIYYTEPVYDPWFSATRRQQGWNYGVTYLPDRNISVMGCTMQWTVCNPSLKLCTPAGGLGGLRERISRLSLNAAQNTTAERILNSMALRDPGESLSLLNAEMLWANDLVTGNLSPGLPNNQWQTEVLSWFLTSLILIQADSLNYAAKAPGYFKGGGEGTVLKYVDDYQCRNQLISSMGEAQNFSVLGLSIALGMCLVLILSSILVERLADCVKRRDHLSLSQVARQADDKFHLLRMALSVSKRHSSQWELSSNDLPITYSLPIYNQLEIVDGLVSYS